MLKAADDLNDTTVMKRMKELADGINQMHQGYNRLLL